MPPQHPPVYLDTCVILAAHRAGCWRALAPRFSLHTTQVCRAELTQGNPKDPHYIAVDMQAFDQTVTIHLTTTELAATAALQTSVLFDIDAGERDLLAWGIAQPDALLLTTGDRAAILAACRLGLQDKLISLEELARDAGLHKPLPKQFTKAWLSEVRTKFLMEAGGL